MLFDQTFRVSYARTIEEKEPCASVSMAEHRRSGINFYDIGLIYRIRGQIDVSLGVGTRTFAGLGHRGSEGILDRPDHYPGPDTSGRLRLDS